MTSILEPKCYKCVFFRTGSPPLCDKFMKGIPKNIFYKGKPCLLFEPKEDEGQKHGS